MSYKVLDVCRHVINYSNEHDYGISNLKLQKVLYFIQAYFLTKKKDHTPCFDEKIEAWDLLCQKHTMSISSMEVGIYLQ